MKKGSDWIWFCRGAFHLSSKPRVRSWWFGLSQSRHADPNQSSQTTASRDKLSLGVWILFWIWFIGLCSWDTAFHVKAYQLHVLQLVASATEWCSQLGQQQSHKHTQQKINYDIRLSPWPGGLAHSLSIPKTLSGKAWGQSCHWTAKSMFWLHLKHMARIFRAQADWTRMIFVLKKCLKWSLGTTTGGKIDELVDSITVLSSGLKNFPRMANISSFFGCCRTFAIVIRPLLHVLLFLVFFFLMSTPCSCFLKGMHSLPSQRKHRFSLWEKWVWIWVIIATRRFFRSFILKGLASQFLLGIGGFLNFIGFVCKRPSLSMGRPNESTAFWTLVLKRSHLILKILKWEAMP